MAFSDALQYVPVPAVSQGTWAFQAQPHPSKKAICDHGVSIAQKLSKTSWIGMLSAFIAVRAHINAIVSIRRQSRCWPMYLP